MDDTLDMLEESVGRMLAAQVQPRGTLAAEQAGIDAQAWSQLGLLGVAGPDAAQMEFAAHAVVLKATGYAAALVPYAESEALGRWLALGAGIDSVDEVLTVAVLPPSACTFEGSSVQLALQGRRIPWARHSQRVLFSIAAGERSFVAEAPTAALRLAPSTNVAAEPHDTVASEPLTVGAGALHEVESAWGPEAVMARGALCRVLQMQGAMAKVNELTLQYSHDRKQFSRSLSQYQIVQSYLAAMAGELCAMEAAAETAIAAIGDSQQQEVIAAAKVRAGQAARVIVAHGHQVHGAIGFTREFPLNLWTRRLWAWREEYGNETRWARRLGAAVVRQGADALWANITREHGG